MSALKDKKTGLWYYVFKVQNPITGKLSWKKKRGFATKREAQHAEADAQRLKHDTVGELTFKDISHQWEDYRQSSKASRRQHTEHFAKRFSELYELPIKKIKRAALADWYNALSKDTTYSTQTKNVTISYVKSVYKYANEVYDVPNISTLLRRLKKTDSEIINEEMSVWTVDEFNQFISSVNSELYKLFFSFLFWTGCRRGEAIALQKSDIEEDWITIKYSQRSALEGLKPTKTKNTRKIQMDSKLLSSLQPLLDAPGNYLFGGEHPLSPTEISRQFNKGIVKSGVSKIRIHDLRHSHATFLINSGVNIVAVSKRLGHTNIEQTLKTYTHLLDQTNEALINTINIAKS